MERIEREIAAGRVAIPVMYRRPSQHQEVVYSEDDDKSTSSDESSDRSSYSGYQSSEAEWEASVDSRGELIYVDCHPITTKKLNKEQEYNFQRTRSRRSGRGKFLRLLRKRESKRKLKTTLTPGNSDKKLVGQNSLDSSAGGSNKVTFRDCQEGEEREVSLIVDPKNRIKYGRQVTISEAVLGLTLSSFSDGVRIMVAGIVPDSEAAKHRNIKIGDWLKSINDREVNTKNVTNVLDRIKNPCVVRLKLQRIAGVEVTTEPPPNKIPKQSEFVRQLINPCVEEDNEIAEILCKLPVSVLFLTTEGLSETGPEFQGVYYCYPGPLKQNKLCVTRGAFVTLHHLLPDIIKSKVLSTQVLIDDTLTNVIYSSEGSEIFLLALPNNRCSLRESVSINNEIVETLKFMYQTLNRCFLTEENLLQLDHFFARFFTRILNIETRINSSQNVEAAELLPKTNIQYIPQFEDVLRVAHYVPLPRDVQLDIDDCLSEMEACDYREWNEDPMDCQRLYTIIGSCLYHSGYLLGSHFQNVDLLDVHSFCRQQGLLHLFRTESVRSFVLWREVYPASCNRGQTDKPLITGGYQIPKGRWFLLIVGYDQDMLVVIFEAGGCTVPAEGKPGPDPFYVEEVQYTLEDIKCTGVIDIARKWIEANIYPQVIFDIGNKISKKGSIQKPKIDNQPMGTKTSPLTFGRKQEVTSILKRRSSTELNHSQQYVSCSSLYAPSGDVSDESRSFRSINSDEHQPVIGRREARERGVPIGDNSESDSEWNASRGASHSGSSFDLSDIRQALLTEIDSMPPYKVTAGKENVLFHYVKLDEYEGIMLCPTINTELCSDRYKSVLNNFRRCSHSIHKLFERTLRFKNLLNHNTEKPIINKSLVAIKEHGVLFECFPSDENKKAKTPLKYWVVGRLFSEPHPRELYVCYDESIPQSVIEIAFRLGILEAG